MDAYEVLVTRVSPVELGEPAPEGETRAKILTAALRAPDHGRLRPWRFLVIEGEARAAFGDVLAGSLARRQPGVGPDLIERERKKALRAPLIVGVVAKVAKTSHIPVVEQVLSAGAAAQNILLACHALGFAGVWKTGDAAYDREVKMALGLAEDDAIVGFLYVGTAKSAPRPPEIPSLGDFCKNWPG